MTSAGARYVPCEVCHLESGAMPHFGDGAARLDMRGGSAALGGQHLRDVACRAVAEQLAQRLLVIGNAVLLHQADEVRRGIARQRRLGEVRVGGEEVLRPCVQVGEVAAPAAGDEDFPADPGIVFEHGDAAPAPPGFDRAHQPGGAGADDQNVGIEHIFQTSILPECIPYNGEACPLPAWSSGPFPRFMRMEGSRWKCCTAFR